MTSSHPRDGERPQRGARERALPRPSDERTDAGAGRRWDEELSRQEILRYSRHLILPGVGLEGQRALKAARVLIVGAGGLGSPAALYLAASGVGAIGIADLDAVDTTNLQRQVLHRTSDVGRSKVDSAAETMRELNPHVDVVRHEVVLDSSNALDIVGAYDVIVDGTDNFPTRYLLNDACVMLGKPLVYGSIFRFDGQMSVFAHDGGPCYRCLFPEPPPPGTVPTCAEGGVLGVLPGVVGAIQATEAIKLILGTGETLAGRLLLYDALRMQFREIRIERDPACAVCGEAPTIRGLIDYDAFCGVPGHDVAPVSFDDEIEPVELKARLDRGDRLTVIDVREPGEHAINRIDEARLIPLADLPARVHELDTADEIVALCHLGIRSARACQLLRDAGFGKVRNLRGGMRAWVESVDPSQPQY